MRSSLGQIFGQLSMYQVRFKKNLLPLFMLVHSRILLFTSFGFCLHFSKVARYLLKILMSTVFLLVTHILRQIFDYLLCYLVIKIFDNVLSLEMNSFVIFKNFP